MGEPQTRQHNVCLFSTQQWSRKCFSESLNSEAVMREGVRTALDPFYTSSDVPYDRLATA
jgi:hypothetical protein